MPFTLIAALENVVPSYIRRHRLTYKITDYSVSPKYFLFSPHLTASAHQLPFLCPPSTTKFCFNQIQKFSTTAYEVLLNPAPTMSLIRYIVVYSGSRNNDFVHDD